MDLKSIFQTLSNQRLVVAVVLAAGVIIAVFAAVFVHGRYAATASVLLVAGNETGTSTAQNNGTTNTTPLLSGDLPTIAQTSMVLNRVSRDLNGAFTPAQLYRRIRTDVYANSDVMSIRFTGSSPWQARFGANAVADEVVNYYRTIATSRFDSLASDLKRQMTTRQSDLRRIDSQVQSLTAQYPYIEDGAGGSDGTTINARLVALQSQRDQLVATLAGDLSQATVTNERLTDVAPLAQQQLANADPSYTNALQQYGRDAAELRRQQTHFSGYPGLAELKDIVSSERTGLKGDKQRIASQPLSATQPYADALAQQTQVRSLVASDRSKLEQIQTTIAQLQNELTAAATRGTAVDALRRQRASGEAAYQLLSQRLALTLADRAAAASTGSLMVYDRPSYAWRTPTTQPAVIAAAVMIMAMWIAITLAFIFENQDRRFRNVETIESVYGSHVLGVAG